MVLNKKTVFTALINLIIARSALLSMPINESMSSIDEPIGANIARSSCKNTRESMSSVRRWHWGRQGWRRWCRTGRWPRTEGLSSACSLVRDEQRRYRTTLSLMYNAYIAYIALNGTDLPSIVLHHSNLKHTAYVTSSITHIRFHAVLQVLSVMQHQRVMCCCVCVSACHVLFTAPFRNPGSSSRVNSLHADGCLLHAGLWVPGQSMRMVGVCFTLWVGPTGWSRSTNSPLYVYIYIYIYIYILRPSGYTYIYIYV